VNTFVLVTFYMMAAMLANGVVSVFGPAALPITAFCMIPFDLFSRDLLHDRWKGRALWPKMALLVTGGSVLSALCVRGASSVALASLCAFIVAGAVDCLVYHRSRAGRFSRMLRSNAASSLTDSIIFPAIAFGMFDIGLTCSQAGAKFLGSFLWVGLYALLRRNSTTTNHNNHHV
jgi:hypothetical protein